MMSSGDCGWNGRRHGGCCTQLCLQVGMGNNTLAKFGAVANPLAVTRSDKGGPRGEGACGLENRSVLG